MLQSDDVMVPIMNCESFRLIIKSIRVFVTNEIFTNSDEQKSQKMII